MDEGFEHVYVWRDAPHTEYRDHSHPFTSCHIILDGEMEIISEHMQKVLKPGDRLDVIAGTIHSAIMGSDGCRYIVAEKY